MVRRCWRITRTAFKIGTLWYSWVLLNHDVPTKMLLNSCFNEYRVGVHHCDQRGAVCCSVERWVSWWREEIDVRQGRGRPVCPGQSSTRAQTVEKLRVRNWGIIAHHLKPVHDWTISSARWHPPVVLERGGPQSRRHPDHGGCFCKEGAQPHWGGKKERDSLPSPSLVWPWQLCRRSWRTRGIVSPLHQEWKRRKKCIQESTEKGSDILQTCTCSWSQQNTRDFWTWSSGNNLDDARVLGRRQETLWKVSSVLGIAGPNWKAVRSPDPDS